MSKKTTDPDDLTVYEREGYKEIRKFSDQLQNENSAIGRIVSAKNLRKSSARIRLAILETIEQNGHGVILRRP